MIRATSSPLSTGTDMSSEHSERSGNSSPVRVTKQFDAAGVMSGLKPLSAGKQQIKSLRKTRNQLLAFAPRLAVGVCDRKNSNDIPDQ